jgi:hypothetical protein
MNEDERTRRAVVGQHGGMAVDGRLEPLGCPIVDHDRLDIGIRWRITGWKPLLDGLFETIIGTVCGSIVVRHVDAIEGLEIIMHPRLAVAVAA